MLVVESEESSSQTDCILMKSFHQNSKFGCQRTEQKKNNAGPDDMGEMDLNNNNHDLIDGQVEEEPVIEENEGNMEDEG